MDINLDTLRDAIAAEVSRREYERLAATGGEAAVAGGLVDAVEAFEPIDLEGYLPEPPSEPQHVPPELVVELLPEGRLYNLLRHKRIAPHLQRPRFYSLLTRASRLPGGASFSNMAYLVGRGIAYRVPWLARLIDESKQWRYLPGRLAGFEYQANQGLYAHALATQRNDEYLLRRIQTLEQRLRELQARQPAASVQAPVAETKPEPGMPAELYVDFEARFRGSPEEIRGRLANNLPLFQAVAALGSEPVLDLGCGRGEWLQLLADSGIRAVGVDSNPSMVQRCIDAGLDAQVGDALEYLERQPDQSLSGLTAFHVIEHVPLDVLIRLIDEARRVVRPGGIVLFETPNPENLIVGACNFYTDPTHRNPLPPALVGFLLEARGFVRVDIDRRHPADPKLLLQGQDDALIQPLNRLLFGPQDYAAIGYVP
ncbi:class I SAM-dependent methyltransferase [Stutzerimonas kunmingensis]|uniref:class I SAM-dependent methyltransferase n=1 Tax=Stutzerimonas kunmingensis TaxID=1211807 RepID=UPI00241DF8DB|nr:class I SAM-dependent methyltransferase [Stutzerimonas kunmingensis]